jgi:hypothetical protein
MEAVALPGIVAEHDIGAQAADPRRHLPPLAHPRLELAVGPAEEHHLARAAQRPRRLPLLLAPGGDQRAHVHVGVPRPLRPVGADQVADLATGRGPFGERAPAAELHVVGMGADGEGPRRQGKVDGEVRHEWARSDGRSTSRARSGARTTRSGNPRRWASARWRANDPGP